MATGHITEALWSATTEFRSYPQLSGDIEVDVAIVGAGITGISAAYVLSRAGKRVAVLEALRVGSGTTGSSTGNLYAPIDERLYTIDSKHGEEALRAVAASRTAAVDFVEARVREFGLDCDFERVSWYLFSEPGDDLAAQVERERNAAATAGLAVTDEVPADFPFLVAGMTNVPNQAQFNPLKYVQGLAAAVEGDNCRIYEGTKVLDTTDGEPCLVRTAQGTVRARQVVMATHSPKGIYGVHTTMEPHREYALAVRLRGDAVPAPGTYWNVRQVQHYSIRPYRTEQGNFLLILGEGHKVGHKEHNEKSLRTLEQYVRERFEVEEVVFRWAAQNYKPADALPYIGTSPLQTNTYIATGYAADGLTYGTLAGMIIGDLIGGRDNKWARLYDPKRITPLASAPNFIKANVDVAFNLAKDYLLAGRSSKFQDIEPGEGKIMELDNKKVAVYRDEENQLHLVSAVCTHMGCVVHFNNAEKSWDCPCHGSRFSIEGEVLEGPAYQNLAKPDFSEE